MIIYFISGLGADERIFQRLRLPAGYEMQHISWQKTAEKQTIGSYARQMAAAIDSAKPFMLAGLSFGGMIATEICKFLKPEKLILFSTVKTAAELPAFYRFAGKLKLYRVFPPKTYKTVLPFLYWFLGAHDDEGRKLISSFFDKMDPLFLKWAIREITCWRNFKTFEPHLHLHGGLDRVFPISSIDATHIISAGTHLSVFYDAERINEILGDELNPNKKDHRALKSND